MSGYTEKALSIGDIDFKHMYERYRELVRQSEGKDYDWARSLIVACFKENWCMCTGHARWAAYCLTAAATAVVTKVWYVPPEVIDDVLDREIEYAIWKHFDEAMRMEPNLFAPEFRSFMLRHFAVDVLRHGTSNFSAVWSTGLFLRRRDISEAWTELLPEVVTSGEAIRHSLSKGVQDSIERMEMHFSKMLRVYEMRRLPRLMRSIENDNAIRAGHHG